MAIVDTKKQEQLRRLIEDPRRRRFWAPRGRRRTAVVLLALVVLVGALAFAGSITVDGAPAVALLGVFLGAMVAITVLATQINIAARWVAGYRGLDEFQRSETDRAAHIGFNVTTASLVLLVMVTTALGGAFLVTELSAALVMAVIAPVVLVATFAHTAFPAAYLAWTRPDELPDDEDEPEDEVGAALL